MQELWWGVYDPQGHATSDPQCGVETDMQTIECICGITERIGIGRPPPMGWVNIINGNHSQMYCKRCYTVVEVDTKFKSFKNKSKARLQPNRRLDVDELTPSQRNIHDAVLSFGDWIHTKAIVEHLKTTLTTTQISGRLRLLLRTGHMECKPDETRTYGGRKVMLWRAR